MMLKKVKKEKEKGTERKIKCEFKCITNSFFEMALNLKQIINVAKFSGTDTDVHDLGINRSYKETPIMMVVDFGDKELKVYTPNNGTHALTKYSKKEKPKSAIYKFHDSKYDPANMDNAVDELSRILNDNKDYYKKECSECPVYFRGGSRFKKENNPDTADEHKSRIMNFITAVNSKLTDLKIENELIIENTVTDVVDRLNKVDFLTEAKKLGNAAFINGDDKGTINAFTIGGSLPKSDTNGNYLDIINPILEKEQTFDQSVSEINSTNLYNPCKLYVELLKKTLDTGETKSFKTGDSKDNKAPLDLFNNENVLFMGPGGSNPNYVFLGKKHSYGLEYNKDTKDITPSSLLKINTPPKIEQMLQQLKGGAAPPDAGAPSNNATAPKTDTPQSICSRVLGISPVTLSDTIPVVTPATAPADTPGGQPVAEGGEEGEGEAAAGNKTLNQPPGEEAEVPAEVPASQGGGRRRRTRNRIQKKKSKRYMKGGHRSKPRRATSKARRHNRKQTKKQRKTRRLRR